jgi:CheY-like chemotaxis protein
MSHSESPLSSRGSGEPLAAAPPESPHWEELFDELSRNVASRLAPALERIQALAATGRISRQDLRALREAVEGARHAGEIGQQLMRVASDRARASRQSLSLANVVGEILSRRGQEADRRGLHIGRILAPVQVSSDPALLTRLIDTMLDWVFGRAHSEIELRTEARLPSPQAALTCSFAERSAAARGRDGGGVGLTNDSLVWRLLEQTATAAGARLQCSRAPTQTLLTLEFLPSGRPSPTNPNAHSRDEGNAGPRSGKTLAGHHVLVLAARSDLRSQIRESIRPLGLMVDFVDSVGEASAFCAEGLPHAIVFDAALHGEQLEQLRNQIRTEAPDFSFIEIVERDDRFEVSSVSVSGGPVGLAKALPSALKLELCKKP